MTMTVNAKLQPWAQWVLAIVAAAIVAGLGALGGNLLTVGRMDERLNSLETLLTRVEASVSTMARITDIDSRLALRDERIAALVGEIADHETRIRRLEGGPLRP